MKKFRILVIAFLVLAILRSVIMCANVAFDYCSMLTGINSAGPNVAFFIAIPYIIGIVFCVIFSYFLWKKSNQSLNAYGL